MAIRLSSSRMSQQPEHLFRRHFLSSRHRATWMSWVLWFRSTRMERGQGEKSALTEIEENYGIKTTAIVTMAEVVEHLYNREYKGRVIIDDTLKAAIDAYYDQYGVK